MFRLGYVKRTASTYGTPAHTVAAGSEVIAMTSRVYGSTAALALTNRINRYLISYRAGLLKSEPDTDSRVNLFDVADCVIVLEA